MNCLWHLSLLVGLWVSNISVTQAQTKVSVREQTNLSTRKDTAPDSSASATTPKSLTFTASTDQRFFFFNDTRNDNGRRVPVSVYGFRAGFLFPVRNPEKREPGGMRASFKTGVGFYFVNQTIDRPGLLPNTSEAVTRHLRIVTGYFEPYLFRKKAIEISLPLELGYGHSRYELVSEQPTDNEVARGIFIPAGIGLSSSYQFPSIRWLRPLHWFGFNLLTGYRFTLKRDLRESQVNYSGFYISVGPSFYLENLTSDIQNWRKKRKKSK
jgi:hypothetical protein